MKAAEITRESLKAETEEILTLARDTGEPSALRKCADLIEQLGFPRPDDHLPTALHRTCLYRHFDKHGTLLYVGISNNPISRFDKHLREADWMYQIARVDVQWFPNRAAAEKAEAEAIKSERPWYNKRGSPLAIWRVDRGYPEERKTRAVRPSNRKRQKRR